MKMYGAVEVYLHVFLASEVDGGEWSASRTGRFTTGERAPRYSLDRRLGGPQSRTEHDGEKKIPAPAGNRTPGVQPVAQSLYWLSYPGSPTSIIKINQYLP
jgi:hypothetical protein